MSVVFDGVMSLSDGWSEYIIYPQVNLYSARSILLSLCSIPVLAVVLNVLKQLVSSRDFLYLITQNVVFKRSFRGKLMSHLSYSIGSLSSVLLSHMVVTLSIFSPSVAKRYIQHLSKTFYLHDDDNIIKYGDVFTFILLGRRITVSLGTQGNDFVLGGKSVVLNAEDAYTVSIIYEYSKSYKLSFPRQHLTTPVFGKGVVYDVPNEVFMQQKKSAKVGFTTDNMRAYVGMIEEEVENFLQTDPAFSVFQSNNEEWGQFDALKVFQVITILTASRTLQGKEVRAGLDSSYADVYHDLDGGFTPLNFLFPNLPLPSYKRRDIAQKKMSDFYVKIVQQRRNGSTEDVSLLSL